MAEGGRYRVVVDSPVWVAPGGEDGALRTVVGTLEGAVRRHPTQWFNFFDVWEGIGDRAA